MTNYEKYKNDIAKILADCSLAVKDGQPVLCASIPCEECKYYENHNCTLDTNDVVEFLDSEYVEHPKLAKNERMLCETLEGGYIGRDKDGSLYLFSKKPNKDHTIWKDGAVLMRMDKAFNNTIKFDFIQWKDKEPWSIEDLLKLEVKE